MKNQELPTRHVFSAGEVIEKCGLEPFPFIEIGKAYGEMFNEVHKPLEERED